MEIECIEGTSVWAILFWRGEEKSGPEHNSRNILQCCIQTYEYFCLLEALLE